MTSKMPEREDALKTWDRRMFATNIVLSNRAGDNCEHCEAKWLPIKGDELTAELVHESWCPTDFWRPTDWDEDEDEDDDDEPEG